LKKGKVKRGQLKNWVSLKSLNGKWVGNQMKKPSKWAFLKESWNGKIIKALLKWKPTIQVKKGLKVIPNLN